MVESYKEEAERLSQEIIRDKALLQAKEQRLAELMETYCLAKCPKCGLVICREDLACGSYMTTPTEFGYVDCAYGENDEIAEVTFANTVKRCPKCGHEIERHRTKVKEENRRQRAQ